MLLRGRKSRSPIELYPWLYQYYCSAVDPVLTTVKLYEHGKRHATHSTVEIEFEGQLLTHTVDTLNVLTGEGTYFVRNHDGRLYYDDGFSYIEDIPVGTPFRLYRSCHPKRTPCK